MSRDQCKIWILVADWSRFQSVEPNAGDVARKIGPLYFNCTDMESKSDQTINQIYNVEYMLSKIIENVVQLFWKLYLVWPVL